MKKAVVSLAAVLMVLASFATPSFAAGDATTHNGTRFNASVNVPATVRAGQVLNVSGSITLLEDGSNAKTRMVGYSISTGLGQSRSAFKAMPVGKPKSIAKGFSVPSRIEPGVYNIRITIGDGPESWTAIVPVEVTK